MNTATNLLLAPVTDTADLDEVLNATAHMDTADLLAMMGARLGACTGLELVLLNRFDALQEELDAMVEERRAMLAGV